MKTPERYSISQLARLFDITPRSIRHYEEKGLLRPARQGKQRVYGRGDRVRLQLILRGKRVGFSLEEIGEILDLYHGPRGEERQRRFLLAKLAEKRAQLEEQRQCIDNMLRELDGIEQGLLEQRGA